MHPSSRSIHAALLALASLGLLGLVEHLIASIVPQAGAQTFRTDVRMVAVYATVRDRDGRLVPDLGVEDFRIVDNGAPATIVTFSNQIQPFKAVLLLDMSYSMVPEYTRVRDAAQRLVNVLLPADRVRIGTFGREVSVSPLLTGDKAILNRVLEEEVWPGGGTPLWRAATAAMDSLANEAGRRVIIVLTDGGDSGGDFNCAPLVSDPHGQIGACPGRLDVRRKAQDEGFMFYAIGLEGHGLDQGIKDIVRDTGGGHFELKRNADLDGTFERVAEELHHQYVLGFTPLVLDGRTHQLDVQLIRPSLSAQARKTYLADSGR